MSTQDDGGPAFPFKAEYPTTGPQFHPGMSLRDWFAGQVMNGMSAMPEGRRCPMSTVLLGDDAVREWQKEVMENDCRFCYRVADAMLRVRKE